MTAVREEAASRAAQGVSRTDQAGAPDRSLAGP